MSDRPPFENWQGRPVRVDVMPPVGRDQTLTRLQGIVTLVEGARLSLELMVPFHDHWLGAELVVEVLLIHALVRFPARALPVEGRSPHSVQVPLPEKIDFVQRRRYDRVDMTLPIEVYRRPGGTSIGRIVNLSPGGIGMILPDLVPLEERVFVAFKTEEGALYEDLLAKVVRSEMTADGFLTAISFTDLHPDIMAALGSYVSRMIKGEHNKEWKGRLRL